MSSSRPAPQSVIPAVRRALGVRHALEGEICIGSHNRNFRARMGHKDSKAFLASPETGCRLGRRRRDRRSSGLRLPGMREKPMKTIQGPIWKFGDGIDTDMYSCPLSDSPARRDEREGNGALAACLRVSLRERRGHCGRKEFWLRIEQGAGSRGVKALGVAAIVAESFARIFYRNAINLGVPVVECEGLAEHAREGDIVEIRLSIGKIRLIDRKMEFSGSRLPDFLLEIIEDGGLIRNLTKDT